MFTPSSMLPAFVPRKTETRAQCVQRAKWNGNQPDGSLLLFAKRPTNMG
jgi:hypothetical protein